MIRSFALKKRSDLHKFVVFCFPHVFTVFYSFSSFYPQERIAPIALRSVALYKKAK